MTSLLC